MTSDTRPGTNRWPALLVLLTGLATGCGEAGAKKSEGPPAPPTPTAQPAPEPRPNLPKGAPPPPKLVKME